MLETAPDGSAVRPAHGVGPPRALGRQRQGRVALPAVRLRVRLRRVPGPETGVRDRVGYLLEQGRIRLLVSAGLTEDSEIVRHVRRHGDGVRTVAFTSTDVDVAFESAVRQGARPLDSPNWLRDSSGSVRTASIACYGSTRHSFVDRRDYGGGFAPASSPTECLRFAQVTRLASKRSTTSSRT